MDLVNRQDRCGRIVNRRGKRLGGDIHDDPEGKSRVLLHRPFLAQSDRLTKRTGRWPAFASKDAEQRAPGRHEIPHLGHQLDHTLRLLGQGHESLEVESQEHPVLRARDRAGRLTARCILGPVGGVWLPGKAPGIDILDHLVPQAGHRPQGPARAQRLAHMINEEQENAHAEQAQVGG